MKLALLAAIAVAIIVPLAMAQDTPAEKPAAAPPEKPAAAPPEKPAAPPEPKTAADIDTIAKRVSYLIGTRIGSQFAGDGLTAEDIDLTLVNRGIADGLRGDISYRSGFIQYWHPDAIESVSKVAFEAFPAYDDWRTKGDMS